MNTPVTEHDKVVSAIRDGNASRYKVLTNLEKYEHYISQLFPDLILLDRETDKPVFIIEVKRNGNIAQCIQQWKNVPSIPATLYILVPESDLANAKSIAEVVGLKTKFGTYYIDENGNNIRVKYE